MQRKRTRDYYSAGTVELGTSLINVTPMKKLTMKRLMKWMIIIIILYVVYSMYKKSKMASSPVDDYEAMYGNRILHEDNREVDKEDVVDDIVERRVKEQINKVFEDLKRDQEAKQKQEDEKDVFQDYNDLIQANKKDPNEDEQNDELEVNEEKEYNELKDNDEMQQNGDIDVGDENDDNIVEEGNDNNIDENEMFGDDDNNDANPDVNIRDEFEPIDEKKEHEEIELEQEIEELLADAFKEAEKEAEVEAKKDHVIDAVEEQNAAAVNEQENINKAGDSDGLRIQRVKADMVYQHQMEFNNAVKQMGRKLHPLEIKRMNEMALRKGIENDDDHELPPFVTAVRQTTVNQVIQLVASIQQHLPGRKIYVYDLDLTKEQKKEFMSYCGVRVRLFMASVFPKYVRNLDNLHWKPLIMQTALSEFGHITWINPQYKLGSHEVAPLVHESHEKGILVVGQKVSYSTFSATHPDMLKFLPTDTEKLKKTPHMEIRAIMIHNTDEVHEKIMKVFTACALEESCIAPEGAKLTCRFDFTGRKYADCHRYDESALNILLKNWFDYDMNQFARGNNYFRSYDPSYKPKPKQCRSPRDIKDSEL